MNITGYSLAHHSPGQGEDVSVRPGPGLQRAARAQLRALQLLRLAGPGALAHLQLPCADNIFNSTFTDLVLHEAVYEGADALLGQTLDVQRQAPLAQCVEPFARLEYL